MKVDLLSFDWEDISMRRNTMKKKGGLGLFMDVLLTFLTGGLWLIVLFIRFLRNNS